MGKYLLQLQSNLTPQRIDSIFNISNGRANNIIWQKRNNFCTHSTSVLKTKTQKSTAIYTLMSHMQHPRVITQLTATRVMRKSLKIYFSIKKLKIKIKSKARKARKTKISWQALLALLLADWLRAQNVHSLLAWVYTTGKRKVN